MYRVHYYDNSEAAYDACLDTPCIEEGDVIAILSEHVIGLASSDPIAITLEHGAFRAVPAMPASRLLEELVHDRDQLRHAVELALAHHLPVAPHFLAFALRNVPLPVTCTVVALTLDDIMVAVDAIRHHETRLNKRAGLVDPQTSHGLFLASTLRKLATARRHLSEHPPLEHPTHPSG